MIIRIVVDFPAPFGPRNPVTAPGPTVNVAPSTAVRPPYRLDTARASIIRLPSPFVAAQGRRARPSDRPAGGRDPVPRRCDSRRTGYAAGRTRPSVDRATAEQLF